MIWLASFPRSGNTFFRNILYEVYGIPSGEYHLGRKKDVDPDFSRFEFVKTHLLPDQLPLEYQSKPSIYIIRDGRDALVSLAHHRKEIKKTNNNYCINLLEVILGIGGSFSKGWSHHVKVWKDKSDILIRFEDLILDPIGQVERLRSIVDLPRPKLENLPGFQSLKNGIPEYGSGKEVRLSKNPQQEHANKFYRRGITGSYKDEMPRILQLLYWLKHKKQMNAFQYYDNS